MYERKFNFMENNNTNSENKGGADTNTDINKDKNTTESITMSKTDYEKAIQDAKNKVKEELSKEIEELEAKVKELSPTEKTQAEIDIEKRLAALEASEKALADKESKIAMQEKLSTNGLDKKLVDYIKSDADIEKLSTILNDIVKSRIKFNNYIPNEHSSDDKMTLEEFNKMTYSQKVEFTQKHPEAYKRLRGRK